MQKRLTILSLLAISVPAVADDRLSVGSGFDYSKGTYGNAVSTSILYIPVVGKYESDNLTLKLTVPYISVTGPGGVIMGFGRMGSPGGATAGAPSFGRPAMGSGTTTSTNSGLGDVVASADYSVYSTNALSLDVVGKVKFGTADSRKGLGTGLNDYSAQVDGYYTPIKKTTLFATAGYKVVSVPTGITANNVPYGMLGASQKIGDATDAGVMLSVSKSATASTSNPEDVTVYVAQKLTKSLKIQADVLKGYTNGSPDFGGGIMITGYL